MHNCSRGWHGSCGCSDVRSLTLFSPLQIEELAKAVQPFKASGRVVLAGDFNIRRKTAMGANEYKFLIDKLNPLKDVFPNMECDHVFVSSSLNSGGKLRVLNERTLNLCTSDGLAVSDHYGLRVALSVS